jgi:hypothetical protein
MAPKPNLTREEAARRAAILEDVSYDVHVNYPGDDGPAVTYLDLVCVSDESDAACEVENNGR